MNKRPIGIFDSGMGGLTVLSEIKKRLPNENFIYLGDTQNFPYGSKSKEQIIEFSIKNTEKLIDLGAKCIVIACGTATSQAIDVLQEKFDIPVIGIIEPTVKYIKQQNVTRIGVIATEGTIRSGAWEQSLKNQIQNIEVINNDNLKLVHKQNISEYENDIITLVFAGNKEIAFSKIKIMFVNNTYSTATFYGRFKIIKEKITKALYDKKIFDSNFKFILNIIKVLSIKIYLNLFCAFIGIHELFSLGKYYNLVLLVIAIVIAVFGFDRLISWLKESDEGTIPLVMCTVLYLAIFIATSDFNFIYILSVAFLFIFNTYIYQKSQQHIFTKYGRLEYIKIYGLKKYIEDYSLIKNRDLESVIIWDKYLAYAVAFDIPNKVMKQFDEGLLNTNIMLQKIDNILKF